MSIEEKAKEFAYGTKTPSDDVRNQFDDERAYSHLVGAHSRGEEVNALWGMIDRVQESIEGMFDGYLTEVDHFEPARLILADILKLRKESGR